MKMDVIMFCQRNGVNYIIRDKADLVKKDKEEKFILKKSTSKGKNIEIPRKTDKGRINVLGGFRRKKYILIQSPKEGEYFPADIDDSKIAPVNEDTKRWFTEEIQNSYIRWKPEQSWIEKHFTIVSFIIVGMFFMIYLWIIGGDITPAINQMQGALKVMSDALTSFRVITPP